MTSPLAADRREGTVVAINAAVPPDLPTVQITLGGDIANEYPARYADWYEPVVGDSVMVLSNKGSHWVLGTSYGPPGKVLFRNNAPTPLSTASGSFVSVPASTSGPIIKRRAGTRLEFDLRVSCYGSAISTGLEWAILVNGTDYSVLSTLINPASQHTSFSGFGEAAGLPAGSYTGTLRVRKLSGAGNVTMDVSDYIHYRITETV
jgi:hypothetical protein